LAANYGVTPNIAVEDNYLENSSMTVALVETGSTGGNSVIGTSYATSSFETSDARGMRSGSCGTTIASICWTPIPTRWSWSPVT